MRNSLSCCLLLASLNLHAFTVSIVKNDAPCGNSTGHVWAIPSGGVPPYSYAWSNGGTTNTMYNLSPGTYSVDVTDASGETVSASTTIEILPNLNLAPNITSSRPDCSGSCDGRIRAYLGQTGGQSPYSYAYGVVGGTETTGTASGSALFFLDGICGSELMWFEATDGNGCRDSITFALDPHTTYTAPTTTVTNACAGEANGSLEVDLTGWFFTDATSNVLIGPGPEDTIPANGNDFFYDGLSPGDYRMQVLVPSYACVEPFYFTITDQTNCGAITGMAFVDLDQDCMNGPNDPVLVHQPIMVQPGNIVRLTNATGGFNIPLDYGSYTVEQPNPDLDQLCPLSNPYPFDLSAGSPVHTVLLADSVTGGIDLSVQFTSSWAIPGFVQTTWITVTNHSPYPTAPITLSFDHEAIFTFVSSTEVPQSIASGNVTWSLPGLGPLANQQVEVQLQVPADPDLIGTTYTAAATITSAGDTYYANNAFEVVGAYDPNDITARTTAGSSTDYFLATDEDIVYTIRFQNTGNFPAQDVHILDTLSELLDMASIQIIGASHEFAAAYFDDRTLRFDFPDIQLPDSTNDEPNSHGYVAYRIKPFASLNVGDAIENTAAIYFDLNPPVTTNTSVVTVQTIQGIQHQMIIEVGVVPNPARTDVQVLRNGRAAEIKSGVIIAADGRRMPIASKDLLRGMVTVEHLATGMYLFDLKETDGTPLRVRVVKE